MRQKVTKIIRNVLRERAITVIGALSRCAIYPRNNVKRDIIGIRTKCGTSNSEGNWKGGWSEPTRKEQGDGGGVGGRWAGRWVGLGCVTKRIKIILQGSEGLTLMI